MTLPSGRELVEANYLRMEARIRELEAALRSIIMEADTISGTASWDIGRLARMALGLMPGLTAPETKAEFCDRCERPLVNGKCPSPRCSPETDGNHG